LHVSVELLLFSLALETPDDYLQHPSLRKRKYGRYPQRRATCLHFSVKLK